MSKEVQNVVGTMNADMEERKYNVRTCSWRTYGNFINEPIVGVAELVANAIDAAKAVDGERIVTIDITEENGKTYLVVKNSGVPFNNLGEALNYGYESSDEYSSSLNIKGGNNQYGTGIKSAFAYFCPEDNGDFIIYTKKENGYESIQSPYGMCMQGYRYSGEWPFEDWCVSVVKTRIIDEIDIEQLEKQINIYFTMVFLMDSIDNNHIVIKYNGKRLKGIYPSSSCAGCTTITNSFVVNKAKVKATKFEYTFNDDAKDDGSYYFPSKDKQGIYLFVNYRLVAHTKLFGVLKKNANEKSVKDYLDTSKHISTHESMNSMITFLNFDIENHDSDMPLTNCKTSINWGKTTGRRYLKIINDFAGERFREKHSEKLEQTVKDFFAEMLMKMFQDDNYTIYKECSLSNDKNSLKADYIVVKGKKESKGAIMRGETPCIKNHIMTEEDVTGDNEVVHIYEFKDTKKLKTENVGQLIGYGSSFKNLYGYMPPLTLVGGSFDKSVDILVNDLRNSGVYPINVIEVKKIMDGAINS